MEVLVQKARRWWWFVSCVLTLPGASSAQLEVTLAERQLKVAGVKAGGEVAILSLWRELVLGGPHLQQTIIEEVLTDDDADGVIELTTERDIPISSIWAVVDTESGESVATVPDGMPVREIQVGKEAAFGRQAGRMLFMLPELRVLVVRPGVGTWRGRARDGSEGDLDGRPDRAVTIDLDVLDPDPPAATRQPALLPGDTVIAIDPRRMAFLNLKLQ